MIWVERRFRIRRGYLIAAYAAFYTFGRFWTEYLRIDHAHRFWACASTIGPASLVFAVSTVVLLTRGRAGPGDECAGDPLPTAADAGDAAAGHGRHPTLGPDNRRRRPGR